MNSTIKEDDPAAPDVRPLIDAHLAFARSVTPPGHVHALTTEGLTARDVTFFTARRNEAVIGMAALKRLGDRKAEIKSMHVAHDGRGLGTGRLLLHNLLEVAHKWGCQEVFLETGTMDAFAPARRLYERAGFVPCEPFGSYTSNPYSLCMRLELRPLMGGR